MCCRPERSSLVEWRVQHARCYGLRVHRCGARCGAAEGVGVQWPDGWGDLTVFEAFDLSAHTRASYATAAHDLDAVVSDVPGHPGCLELEHRDGAGEPGAEGAILRFAHVVRDALVHALHALLKGDVNWS